MTVDNLASFIDLPRFVSEDQRQQQETMLAKAFENQGILDAFKSNLPDRFGEVRVACSGYIEQPEKETPYPFTPAIRSRCNETYTQINDKGEAQEIICGTKVAAHLRRNPDTLKWYIIEDPKTHEPEQRINGSIDQACPHCIAQFFTKVTD